MSFVLNLNDPTDSGTEFSDDDQFDIDASGTLTITAAGEVTYFAPTYWRAIRTRNDHKPGPSKTKAPAHPVRTGTGPLGSPS